MDLKKFLQNFGDDDEEIKIEVNQKNKNGQNYMEGNQIGCKTINYNFDFKDLKKFQELIELSKTEVNTKIKEKVIPIEKLISEGKNNLALKEYNKIMDENDFEKYSKREKFLIYNGVLNCHVNLDSEYSEIEKWSIKIEALGDVEDIHKYYYIRSIWKYNNGELKVSKALNDKAINKDEEYINAKSFDILLRIRMNELGYEDAIEELNLILEEDLPIKDISRTYGILGDVSFMNGKFKESLEYYKDSNEYINNFIKELGMAASLYHLSIKEIRPDGMVDFINIDFKTLKESLALLEKTYNEKPYDLTSYTANILFSYLFNIYSLTAKFDKTIKIVNKDRNLLDFENEDITKLVAQAQVMNKVYDEEVFDHLGEYDVIKFKSLYLELCGEYEKQYDVLLPAIEGNYSSDKLLRLSFLNCLQQLNNFNDYLKYYKRFQRDEIDEGLMMNFIEYLEKLGRKTEMVAELKKLKKSITNPFIAMSYMKILSRNELYDELELFFNSVDKGIYPIIDEHKSMVLYERAMTNLKKEDYISFYSAYEKLDLSKLNDLHRLILTVNYYSSKGDYLNCGKTYFELYKLESRTKDLIEAIKNMIIANEIAVAELYLEYVNPMELEQPELYYMYSVIVLKEREKLQEAFDKLDECKDSVKDIDSPFHQFYFTFNMNNGRTEQAIKYIGKYHEKNPNPGWFKVIKHEENETGEDLIEKIKSLSGPMPDYKEINKLYSAGLFGITVYSVVTKRGIEDIISDKRYPLNKLNITNEDVELSMKKAESIDDSLIIDTNTLIILAKVNALELLNSFSNIYVSQDTYMRIKEMEREFIKNISTKILEYIDLALNVEILPVDISIKDTTDKAKLLPEDTMSSLALSESMEISFLNTEISVIREFKSRFTVNVNALFFKLRLSNPELNDKVALVKRDLRKAGFNFISFESRDIINAYKLEGLQGIVPFVNIDKNAIYRTYLPQYITALIELEKEIEVEEFQKVLAYFVNYFDKYISKTKYCFFNLRNIFETLENDLENVIRNLNIRNIFWFMKKANLSQIEIQLTNKIEPIDDLIKRHNFMVECDKDNKSHDILKFSYGKIQAAEYTKVLKNKNYIKIVQILSFVSQFFIQVLSAFGKTEDQKSIILQIIQNNIRINSIEDINFLIKLYEEVSDKENE